jgi:DNA mismatch endonuclease (patch repair protein)
MTRSSNIRKKSAPSYKGLKPASEIASFSKRANKSTKTKHELLLMSELNKQGLKFKRHVKSLPGKPDIVFPSERLAVFCDGDFWHGRYWRTLKRNLQRGTNSKYWIAKIGNNKIHDRNNTKSLKRMGLQVARFWESDIIRNTDYVIRRITTILRGKEDGD